MPCQMLRLPSNYQSIHEPHEDELFQRVVARMQSRLGGLVREFELTTSPHGLILRGHARTYYSKQLAQEVVMEVSGLSILANEIEVH